MSTDIRQASFSVALIYATKFFKLTLPCSVGDLKSAYRQASKELHPDAGGDGEKFHEMKSAYDMLLSFSGKALNIFKEQEIDGVDSARTVDAISLIDLGQGLGPTINGKDCLVCQHKGYIVEFGRSWTVCDNCDESGYVPEKFPCRVCNGTGKFYQDRAKRTVSCRICSGTGVFTHLYRKRFCPKCLGTKTVWSKDENSPIYRVCTRCDGKGEISIWNPVLPKGRLL